MQLEVGISRRRLSYGESRSARLRLRIVETEVATCSIGDLRTLLSPHMRAKKPRNHAVLEMRGFLRAPPRLSQAKVAVSQL
jgi:hypothetical protein